MAKKNMKSGRIYCVFCGTENDKSLEKCSKCKKNLHPKNHLFREFLYDHIKEDLKDKVTDSIFSYLKNYIISHLYGTVMTFSVIFTTVTVIITAVSGHYKTITSPSDMIKSKNVQLVSFSIYTYDDMYAKNFDPELSNVPFAVAGVISGLKRTIYEIELKKGTTIDEWCASNNEELICTEKLYYSNNTVDKTAEVYRQKILDYAKWVRDSGTENDDEYANRNFELEDLGYEIMYYDELKEYNRKQKLNKSISVYVPEIGCKYDE